MRAQLSAAYEGEAQFQAFDNRIVEIAKGEGASVAELVTELGKQIVLQNIPGYVKLVLVNQFGQWSVAAQNFPPTAPVCSPNMPTLIPPSHSAASFLMNICTHGRRFLGLVVYPAFLIAGAVSVRAQPCLLRVPLAAKPYE